MKEWEEREDRKKKEGGRERKREEGKEKKRKEVRKERRRDRGEEERKRKLRGSLSSEMYWINKAILLTLSSPSPLQHTHTQQHTVPPLGS